MKPHRLYLCAEGCELLGGVVAAHRMMVAGRSEVLAEGNDVDAGIAEVASDGEHFILRLAEAEHEGGLGQHVAGALFGRPAQHVERAFVFGDGTHGRIEARDGLDVVCEHLGAGFDDHAKGVAIALEIGDQHLHRGAGFLANGANGLGEMFSAAVGHVVAIHHRDHRVLHAHLRHRLGHAARLAGVGDERFPFADRAEGAAARADLAEDHERGRAGAPALEDIRTARFLAHRVERQIVHQLRDRKLRQIAGHADLQPCRAMAGAAVFWRGCRLSAVGCREC